jgi:hypothetical protein
LQVGLVGLNAENDLQHSVEYHFGLLPDRMAEIGHQLLKLLVIFYHRFPRQEGKGDLDLSCFWVDLDINVAIGALIVPKSKASQFYPLILPFSLDEVALVQ